MLTAGERDVLILAAGQLTNTEIAARLGMSVVKVKTLIHQASVKLGAHSRNVACSCALRKGYIKIDEVFSPDEVVEIFDILDPDVLNKIAQVLCQRVEREILPMINKDVLPIGRNEDTALTKGERDVLILVGRGLTNREIAEKLFISVGVVGNMLNRANSKLGAHSRGEAFVLALKQRAIMISEVLSVDEILWDLAQLKPETLDKMAQLLRMKLEKHSFIMAGE